MRTRLFSKLRLAIALGALVGTAFGAGLKLGDPAPDFALMGTDNKVVRLNDLLGEQKTVLVFFRTLH